MWIVSCEQKNTMLPTIFIILSLHTILRRVTTAREKTTSKGAPYHRDWMLQLGCSSPSHISSTPASPNLFSPMCSTFKCLFTLRAELMALQQAVVSPHSLILQGKKWYEIWMGDIEALFTSSHKPGQWEQRNQSFSTITVLLSTSYLLDPF